MSHPGKFVKKHPWEAAGMAAAAAAGGAYLPSLLGSSAADAAVAGSPAMLGAGPGGASLGAVAANGLEGSPAFLGADPSSGVSLGSSQSSGLLDFVNKRNARNIARGAYFAQKAGLIGQPEQQHQAMANPFPQTIAPTNTVLPSVQGSPSMAGMDPKTLELLMRLMQQQQQGGMA